MQSIQLAHLHAHPANSNVMPEDLLAKLTAHIANTGRYPPVIVRPHDQSDDAGHYQILDGHHRVEALKRLGHEAVDGIVWEASDDEALLLLATLNRLQGQDDPRKRAAIIDTLSQWHDTRELAKRLPERLDQIKKLLEINSRPPAPRAPQPIGQMPLAVHFFLLPKQKQRLDHRLKQIGGTREQALMRLIEQYHPDSEPADETSPLETP